MAGLGVTFLVTGFLGIVLTVAGVIGPTRWLAPGLVLLVIAGAILRFTPPRA